MRSAIAERGRCAQMHAIVIPACAARTSFHTLDVLT
jgi:hypothetical protein